MSPRPAWRVPLRVAWRDARRSPGRSLLVVALIALPVFALSGADVLARTFQLSTAEKADRQLGRSEALLTWQGGRLQQAPDGNKYTSPDGSTAVPAPSTLGGLLPPGTDMVASVTTDWRVRTAFGIRSITVDDVDYAAPMVRPLTRPVAGRSPRTSGEIALTPALARSAGVGLGGTLHTIDRPRAYTVVGLVSDAYRHQTEKAFLAPGTVTALTPPADRANLQLSWYAGRAGPIGWDRVLRLNAVGLVVASRDVLLHPPPDQTVPLYRSQPPYRPGSGARTVSALVLIGGMVVLEIVLLAGPAFAVGARRSRRSLALLAAVGGTRTDLRNVVLGGGVVLGTAAGLAGLVLGGGAGLALLPLVSGWTDSVPGHLDFRPLELGGVLVLSVLTGLFAAWLPARAAARIDVLAALRGLRGTVHSNRRSGTVGILLGAAGAGLAIGGVAVLRRAEVVLAGAALAEIGLLCGTPALLGLVGRAGRFLPLSARIALRDTSRNRASAAPAVAAIMAAVTGGIAIAVVVASLQDHDRRQYSPSLPYGYVMVQGSPAEGTSAQVADALRRTLPARDVYVVRGLPVLMMGANQPSVSAQPQPVTPAALDHVYRGSYLPAVLVDDGRHLATIAGLPDPTAAAALRAGKAVVFDPSLIKDGRATVTIDHLDAQGAPGKPTEQRHISAVLGPRTFPRLDIVVPPSVATAWGLPVRDVGFLVATSRVPTDREQQAATAALTGFGVNGSPLVETGYHSRYQLGLLILLATSAVITLGAATIATALATVDGRPDLATLAAIGASPRVRRRLSAARAGTIAGLGSLLGVICGMVAPVGYLRLRDLTTSQPQDWIALTIPWPNLATAALIVPALAALVAFAFSSSRLPAKRARSG